jgi:hypothetical protein
MNTTQDEPNAFQGYFDWQVTTLMLAHDIHQPIPPGDEQAADARRRQIEEDVRDMVMEILPEKYKRDEKLDWPAELMMKITRTTISRAAQIADH